MKINNVDVNFKLRTLLSAGGAANYIKAKQKYADAEYIVSMKNSITNSSATRSNQVLRDLGMF